MVKSCTWSDYLGRYSRTLLVWSSGAPLHRGAAKGSGHRVWKLLTDQVCPCQSDSIVRPLLLIYSRHNSRPSFWESLWTISASVLSNAVPKRCQCGLWDPVPDSNHLFPSHRSESSLKAFLFLGLLTWSLIYRGLLICNSSVVSWPWLTMVKCTSQ